MNMAAETINFALKVMTLTGLSAGLVFIGLQLMIRKMEKAPHKR
jgi:hypothetical protein